jgi:nucleotidyltransferase/DNA polymerase involved in DNA repair
LRQLIAKRGALGLAPRCLQWSRRGGVPSCVRPAKVRRLPCRLAKKIRAIFKDHAPLVEPLFRDEAHLNVTDNLKGIASAWETAKEIGVRIFEETELIASAGVSRNKFLAKLASDQR